MAVVLAASALLALVPKADAQTWLRACGDHGRVTCGRVSVPLDPSGHVKGRVSLFIERYAAVPHPEAP